MSVKIDLPATELALLRQITKLDDDAEAVLCAMREFLRLSRLRELRAISEKIDFNGDWQQLEELELAETDFPQ